MANDPLIVDTEVRQNPSSLQPKLTYAGDVWEGQPYIGVLENAINLTASKKDGIALSDKFGVTIGGELSLLMMPNQISIGGGYWRFNPLLLSCIPSTTPTPIPVLVKDTPRLLKAKSDLSSSLSNIISQSDAA